VGLVPLGLHMVFWIFPASQPAPAPTTDDAAAVQGSSTADSLERLNAMRNTQVASLGRDEDLIHRVRIV